MFTCARSRLLGLRLLVPLVSIVFVFAADGGAVAAGTGTNPLLAWGGSCCGELGPGTTTSRDLPVKVKLPNGTKAIAVAAGYYYNLALTSSGQVLAWGFNEDGELGDGTFSGPHRRALPVRRAAPRRSAASCPSARR
jgi:alpha-tubulin suppressor-like RCC1 family protein